MAEEDKSVKQKTQQVSCFGKGNVLTLDLKESREGFRQRGKGRSFHVERPKTEKVREPTEEFGRRNNYNRKLWYGTILWCTQTH